MLRWRLDRGITSQMNMLKKGFSEVLALCVCVSVCVLREREGGREREGEREGGKEIVCIFVYYYVGVL